MNNKVSALINDQINKEFYSAYLYLDMANFYTQKGLDGFANWFEVQAKEEQDHALLMYRYLQNNGEKVTFEAVAKPDKTFEKLIDPLKEGLAHEKYVTSLINTIYEAAQESKDFRTTQFLDLITKMELFGDDARSLYLLNSELAARVYTAPSLVL